MLGDSSATDKGSSSSGWVEFLEAPYNKMLMVFVICSMCASSSAATHLNKSWYGFASSLKFIFWKKYCIIVRISPNWPPSPSCNARDAFEFGLSGE
jgi:hypothetical protein